MSKKYVVLALLVALGSMAYAEEAASGMPATNGTTPAATPAKPKTASKKKHAKKPKPATAPTTAAPASGAAH